MPVLTVPYFSLTNVKPRSLRRRCLLPFLFTLFFFLFSQIAQHMLEQSLGDKLRQLIQDNRTFDNVSYYAQYFSDADYGTTHLSVLAENGDAVAVTTSINFRLDFSQGFFSQNSGRDFRPERYFSNCFPFALW